MSLSTFVTNVLGSVAVEPSIGSRWRTAIERARNTKSLQTFNDWLGSEAGFLSHESLGRYFGPESKNIDDTLRRLIERKAALFDELAARGAPISQFILDWVANFYEERSLQKWLRIASSQVAATPKSGFPAEAEIRSTIENLARAVQGYWEIDGAVLQAMKRLTPPQKKLLETTFVEVAQKGLSGLVTFKNGRFSPVETPESIARAGNLLEKLRPQNAGVS